jgi:hypothetical protein
MASGFSDFNAYFEYVAKLTGVPLPWVIANYVSRNYSRVTREDSLKLFLKYRADLKLLNTPICSIIVAAEDMLITCDYEDLKSLTFLEVQFRLESKDKPNSQHMCRAYKSVISNPPHW